MKLRYSYRLYPDASQRGSSARLFGRLRAVWNDALARRKAAWTADRARISGTRLQQSPRDLDVAHENCHSCGWRIGKISMAVRAWDCLSYGEHHDCDVAAALDILAEGIRLKTQNSPDHSNGLNDVRWMKDVAAGPAGTRNDCAGQVRPGEAIPTLAPPETSTAQAA
ncbi:helix-turn-helix domain-containing protein [Nonomuraea sp. ZG12]|uniref:helix-turn-helix domain-containing protein n=1 Tax=Nonomuraea sp. ZG12 TaxID=3452207 RepID=UPI003F8B925B